MFNIFADRFKFAARQKEWGAPDHWRFTDQRPAPDHATRDARRRDKRRWLRDTGFL